MSRFLVIVFALLTGVTVTSIDSAVSFTYDARAIARVGVHEIGAADAGRAQLSDVREGSASPSAAARGTSTTPARSFIATNNVDDVLRLGTPESWGNPSTLARQDVRNGRVGEATARQ